MVRKSDIVRELVKQKNYRKALSIAKKFVLGITKEEQKTMVRAHECMINPRFYEQLGIDTGEAIKEGVAVLERIYG
ncbi:MAG: hypothetical protein ACI4EO_01570 [Blautia sp.]